MKTKDVPQDGQTILGTKLVHYALTEKGEFEQVTSSGWETGYSASTNLWEEFKELAEKAKERVKNNEASPLEYFMYKACLDLDGLATFGAIPKRKVKKHLTPRGYEKIKDDMLEWYAHVLHTDVETIKNFKSTL